MKLASAVVLLAAGGVASAAESPFQRARKLEREGKEKEAFLAYLAIPGAEYAAARLARPKAVEFLDVVRAALEGPDGIFRPRAKLVEADLLFALGRKDEALVCYGEVLSKIGKGWDDGFMPSDYYPVEPPKERQVGHPVQPFTLGPGSHRDNWLIRRLIALEAWEAAENEFARIWRIHREATKPYVGSRPFFKDGRFGSERCLVRPAGFNGRGLQFAIDYAYFLKRRGSVKDALAVLMEPLLLIDMDRNPNIVQFGEPIPGSGAFSPHWVRFGGGSAGVSRKEFIRLAYGEFKAAGGEADLVEALEKQVAEGRNAARRVLARVRLHQGRPEDALKIELDYIERAGFDELSAAYRRGLVHEDLRKLDKAAADYQEVLALPYRPPKLPDKDEEAEQRQMMCQAMPRYVDPATPAGRAQFQAEVLSRLYRLYTALAQTDRVLGVALRQHEVNRSLLDRLESVERTFRRFRAAGREREFCDWAKGQLPKIESAKARANLCWTLEDYAGTAKALAEDIKQAKERRRDTWVLEQWKERFRKAGKDKLRLLLQALVAADHGDARSRLELIDLEERWEPERVIALLEALLESDSAPAFARGKGLYNRTQFRNYFDLAYRLMRLYEKTGRIDKLRALGLRAARGTRPFHKHDLSQHRSRSENELPEDIQAALSLAVQYADDAATQDELAKALRGKLWPWSAARRQLSRRRAGGIEAPAGLKPFGWANAPRGVTLIASNENVLSLARDDRYVYSGHPWGVAVYDFQGGPVTRIALGEAALALAAAGGSVWVGTPRGLFRILREDWSLSHLWLDGDVPEKRRRRYRERDEPFAYRYDNCVYALALDGEMLWLCLRRNVQMLDTRKLDLRAFSREELKGDSGGYDRILPDGEHVWVANRSSSLRYDKGTDSWQAVSYTAGGRERGVSLIALVDGVFYGHVNLGDPLRDRPCIIDRQTLEVTPILIEGNLTRSERCINGPFGYFGKLDGKPVFGPKYPGFVYDPAIKKLRPLGAPWDRPALDLDTDLLPGLMTGQPWRKAGGTIVGRGGYTHRRKPLGRFQFHTGYWHMLRLPDGTVVLGGKVGSTRYQYPHEDRPSGLQWTETRVEQGGLYFISGGGEMRRASSGPFADSIRANRIYSAVADDEHERLWLCTDGGLSVLGPGNAVLANLSREDGLCANSVLGGAALAGKIYFAACWDRGGGGLAVYDPATSVLTSFARSDGLAANHLRKIEAGENALELSYATERRAGYHRGDLRYQHYSPTIYVPETGAFSAPGEPRLMTERQAHESVERVGDEPMPYLGGLILRRFRRGGDTYLCGTRGLVILREELAPALAAPEMRVTLTAGVTQRLLAEAERMGISRPISLDRLRKLIQHANPYVRADALVAAKTPAIQSRAEYALVIKCMSDPFRRVRTTAVYLLSRAKDEIAIEPLKAALKDSDYYVRAVAAMSLASRGEVPSLSHFEEILRSPRRYGNLPYGASSSIGVQAGKEGAHKALAPYADRRIFALLMKYPIPADDYEPRQKILAELGKSLTRHPEAADVLLKAYDPDKWSWGQVRFAQAVFKHAGGRMLPVLHEALKSEDRVVRSNAARACGAIGDKSSIPHLIRALDLESGLSLASVVWALGELKADEALGELVKLYIDARNDEERRRGSGFRASQSAAAIQAHYDSLRNLDAVGADWNELKAAALPKPVDPRANEDLLSPDHVLEAVRKIGPAASQEFYRTLAGEKDVRARREAAERFAEGRPEDRGKNLPILRNLLADDEVSVRMAAAVSLVILGQTVGERPILEWLDSPNDWEQRAILKQLARIKDATTLSFARVRIEALSRDLSLHRDTRKAALAIMKGTLNE